MCVTFLICIYNMLTISRACHFGWRVIYQSHV